jgi:catalase
MATDKPQCPFMTTTVVPVDDNQNSLTAGARGPDSVANNQPGSR